MKYVVVLCLGMSLMPMNALAAPTDEPGATAAALDDLMQAGPALRRYGHSPKCDLDAYAKVLPFFAEATADATQWATSVQDGTPDWAAGDRMVISVEHLRAMMEMSGIPLR